MTSLPVLGRLSVDRREIARTFRQVREQTERLCDPLQIEDFVVQTMPDVSPTKWHLAHTTWFFETFVLTAGVAGHEPFDPAYHELFNSYYQGVGKPWSRPSRGLLTRPTVARVREYRARVDEQVAGFIERADEATFARLGPVIELGINHEEQHQELILTDIKHVFGFNPLLPAYRELPRPTDRVALPLEWRRFDGGEVAIGHDGGGFCYDNELPRHAARVEPFGLANRLVTCGEYCDFIADGGYERPELWLADGWDHVNAAGWRAPLYWHPRDERAPGRVRLGASIDHWAVFTLGGLRPVDPDEPVCHVSFFEADAFAGWAGAALPSEQEWESAARVAATGGNFLGSGLLHPAAAKERPVEHRLAQMFGDVWEWTRSPYVPYPGFRPFDGALGEYNGKFMCNQLVVRGGSCATSSRHFRPSYRSFFYPHQRWQMTGIRLARA